MHYAHDNIMDRAQLAFVNRMGQSAETDGMSPIAGRLFALLLLSDRARSLDELAEQLGVSKASVSTDARRLLEKQIVERVSIPGDRRDYYELAPDFFAQVIRSRAERWRRLHQLIDGVRNDGPELAPVVRERFASIDDIFSLVVDRVDDALTSWERRPRKQQGAKAAPRRRRSA
jgi:DNA-binding MarR family transcriptional regulator